jgi:VWFA-related protein
VRPHLTFALLAVTLAAAAPFAFPIHQSAAPTPAQDQAIRVGVPLVNLYATVLDKKSAIVPNLEESDFKIFEDKVEQKISFFSRERTLPLSIGLIMDTSGSEAGKIEIEQQSASQFLHRVLRPGDKAFVVAFDAGANLLSDWSSNLDALDRAIHRTIVGIGYNDKVKPGQFVPGGSHLYDVIYTACSKKLTSQTGRKALIVITDAHDEGSDKEVTDAIEAAQRSDTVIQMLIVNNGLFHDTSPDVAIRLAAETGGSALNITTQFRIQNAFDKISDVLRTEYSLGYYPTNSKPDGTFRQLKLELADKNYKAVTRKGYYARTAGK